MVLLLILKPLFAVEYSIKESIYTLLSLVYKCEGHHVYFPYFS